ncbi:MAG: DUF4325 domain-containing protein [Bacillota bacterium]|nr:DUF4325 domain-containing protein [Bacillota bacterium]
MSLSKREREAILDDILDVTLMFPSNLVNIISSKYSISKQTVYKYINKLVEANKIEFSETKKGRVYSLKDKSFSFKLKPGNLQEDLVWVEKIKPILPSIKKNVYDICSYGFTEILNNAIDHAESTEIYVLMEYSPRTLQFIIRDNGIGIFKKIQDLLNLTDPRHAILELAKGKLTSDPTNHSGEGIFFTSRAFDKFVIFSGDLTFASQNSHDWLFEGTFSKKGTAVIMIIDINSNKNISQIFDEYTDKETQGFNKTIIPVNLIKYEGMELISRSQAKRLINRFDKFQEVVLDFKGIEVIGQAFADELFRVFKNSNPQIHMEFINENDNVKKMINHVLNSNNN